MSFHELGVRQIFLNFCFITEEKIHKKLEGSPSPEAELSPAAKDQVEMYVRLHSVIKCTCVKIKLIAATWFTVFVSCLYLISYFIIQEILNGH